MDAVFSTSLKGYVECCGLLILKKLETNYRKQNLYSLSELNNTINNSSIIFQNFTNYTARSRGALEKLAL